MMDSNLSYLDTYISLKSSTLQNGFTFIWGLPAASKPKCYTEETDPTWSCFYEMTAITAAALDIFHIPSEMRTIIT